MMCNRAASAAWSPQSSRTWRWTLGFVSMMFSEILTYPPQILDGLYCWMARDEKCRISCLTAEQNLVILEPLIELASCKVGPQWQQRALRNRSTIKDHGLGLAG